MIRLLKNRVFIGLLGLALFALVVWVVGPYLRFGFGEAEVAPLASVFGRLVAIGLVVGCWVAVLVMRRLRAYRASDKLMAEVAKPALLDPARPSAEAIQLQEGFEDAVATLTKKRRSGHSLYEIPWYVIIGAPGSGKTTALSNSGLRFPVEQRAGKAIRGVGGTRNCDWWFTDEAVFLDTAGRYLTQDSDADADSAAWSEFLGLLRKYRGRRPVNGVILTISAQDLMVQRPSEREVHVLAARRRLEELNRELRLDLPVYLFVTKCDLLAGFSEYFDDLTRDERAQVWGTTFAYEQTTKGEAPRAFPGEFDDLIGRLNERLFARLEQERDIRRRARMFGFPQQVAALKDALGEFVTDVFASTRLDKRVLLRGVYFTSGTQEGTPIDRLLGGMVRQLGLAAEAVPHGKGKAYFVERLFKEVLFAESGLAGVNRGLEARRAALEVGSYAALVLVAILGVAALTTSYRRNSAYVADVGSEVTTRAEVLRNVRPTSLEGLLARLDAVRAVSDSANRYREGAPWLMRWGLYQGASLGTAARNAYLNELNGALLSQTAGHIETRLPRLGPEPEALFEYLKAYLMLGDPARLDKTHLAFVADQEWSAATDNPDLAAGLSRHIASLLESAETLRPIPVDATLIAQARNTITQDSLPTFIFRGISRAYQGGEDPAAIRLDIASGVGADRALRRRSGKPLAEPISGFYSVDVFKAITSRIAADVARQFAADRWVWGDNAALLSVATLDTDVVRLYEDDYIRTWDDVLDDVAPVQTRDLAIDALGVLAAEGSPLRGFLKTVDRHTYVVPPPDPSQGKSPNDRVTDLFNAGRRAVGLPTIAPGKRITDHFAPIHAAVTGASGSAPIDRIVGRLGELQRAMEEVGGGLGTPGRNNPSGVNTVSTLAAGLRREGEALPPPIARFVAEIADGARGDVISGLVTEVGARYQQEVVRQCRELAENRYPFSAASAVDVPLADFGRLFGYAGVYDSFFRSQLEALVDTARTPWRWKTDAGGRSVGGAVPLARFESAVRIREMFFRTGSQNPELRFRVTPNRLSASVIGFELEIDDQRLEYRHGPVRSLQVEWPGKSPGPAAATFIERAGPRPAIVAQGPWAWFRLIDSGRLVRESDARFELSFERNGHDVSLLLEADSIRNPFGTNELRQFRCL